MALQSLLLSGLEGIFTWVLSLGVSVMGVLKMVSDLVGVLAVLVCLVAGLVRVTGVFYLGGFEVLTLFNAGVALMVFSCLLKLQVLQRK